MLEQSNPKLGGAAVSVVGHLAGNSPIVVSGIQ